MDLTVFQAQLRLRTQEDKKQVFDPIRKKWVAWQPEEMVRQLLLAAWLEHGYAPGLIRVERQVLVQGKPCRFDAMICRRDGSPWMLCECKSPDISLTPASIVQLSAYNQVLKAPYLVLTNGQRTLVAAVGESGEVSKLEGWPGFV